MAAYVNNKVISICVYFKVPKVCLQHGALLFLLCKINLKFNKTKQVERLIRSGLGRESFPGASLAEQPLLGYKPALQGNLVWGKEWQGTSAQPLHHPPKLEAVQEVQHGQTTHYSDHEFDLWPFTEESDHLQNAAEA